MSENDGTYASFSLSNRSAKRLYTWCKKAGIKNVKPMEDFHITVCYSEKPIAYQALGLLPPLPVKPKNFSMFGKENNILVLEVNCAIAQNRFEYAKILGAVSDFPDYKPHITVSDDPGIDINDLPEIDFMLYINKETTSVLNSKYNSDKVKTDPLVVKRIMEYYKQVNNR
jgi:peroxiredoxin